MRITVLGKSPAWQDADGACSGYLIEDGDTSLLLDCGNGVFSKLRKFRDYVDLDAVVISHMHADHFLDLVPYAYALTYAPRQQPVPVARWPGTDNPARPQLHVPAGAPRRPPPRGRSMGERGPRREGLRAARVRRRPTRWRSARCACASTRCRTSSTTHAVEIASTNGGGRFTYGADCRPMRGARRSSPRDTDLLMVEATLPRPERTGAAGPSDPGRGRRPRPPRGRPRGS